MDQASEEPVPLPALCSAATFEALPVRNAAVSVAYTQLTLPTTPYVLCGGVVCLYNIKYYKHSSGYV